MSDILNARIVSCKFNVGDKHYAYFTDDPSIGVGDRVLVVAPNGAPGNALHDADGKLQGFLVLVTVVSTDETVRDIEHVREWIVGKVDVSVYFERKARQAARDVIEAKIKRALREARERLDISTLAKDDPKLQALVAELEKLK